MANITSHASISTPPSSGQFIEHEGKQYTTIQEGLAYILIPPEAPLQTDPRQKKNDESNHQSVFYNPIQQYNRDLTVLAIKAFGEDWLCTRQKNREKWVHRRARRPEKKHLPDGSPVINNDEPRNAKRRKISEENGDTVMHSDDSHQTKQPEDKVVEDTKVRDDVDDTFGDGGIPDEMFLVAEEGLETNSSNAKPSQNGNTAKEKDHTPFRILDALSATGLRALRYVKEIPFVTSITANDLSPDAVASIKLNIQHNALPNPNKIKVTTGNAVSLMNTLVGRGHSNDPKYSVIDLDPYGTAIPFLDSAVQALADDGLLCVTCTDTAIFNSMGYLEKTFSQYGGLPMKGDHCHEGGLRLILHAISTAASKYGISMEPLLSLSIDYYARVFVRLRRSPAEVKFHGSKTMMVYSCDAGCGSWKTQFFVRSQSQVGKKGGVTHKHSAALGPTANIFCEHCESKHHVAGPMWGGPLHNPSFIQRILDSLPELDRKVYKTVDRIKGMLTTALEETDLYDTPDHVAQSKDKTGDQKPKQNQDQTNGSNELKSLATFARLPIEVKDPHPFYFTPGSLSKVIRSIMPSDAQLKGALRHLGYRAVRSHAKPGSIKTDAPWSVLWDIMKEWTRQQNHESKSLSKTAPGWRILHKSPPKSTEERQGDWEEVLTEKEELKVEYEPGVGYKVFQRKPSQKDEDTESKPKIVFDEKLGKEERYSGSLVRYQLNPKENWGPMSRAKSKNS
jgi:tRNA (guanine26-N2/guanine27-N2)-dimethyltransferase